MSLYIFTLYSLRVFAHCNQPMGLVGTVFANGQRDLGSIPDRVIPKTNRKVLDAA